MSVRIVEISSYRYEINGKVVYKNIDQEWICPSMDLKPSEEKAFKEHLNSIKNGNQSTNTPPASC